MDKHTCVRCKGQEYIPTHQFVKFEEKVQFLCRNCWDGFKKWFHFGGRAGGSSGSGNG